MNDETPSPFPPTSPTPEPPRGEPPYDPPNFWLMFALGVLLLIASCSLCYFADGPAPFAIGALMALVSLGFRGYRGIFAGFLATIGLAVLVLIIICGNGLRGI